MPTCYHLHVAGVGMIQKWEVAYQHGTEPTHPLPESASPGCRLPTLRHPRPGRKDEPTSARRGFRSSNGNTFHPLPVPSTNDRATFAPGERQRQPQRFRQVRAVHPATGPASEVPANCRPSPKSCCHHKTELACIARLFGGALLEILIRRSATAQTSASRFLGDGSPRPRLPRRLERML